MPPWPHRSVKADLYLKIICIPEQKQTNLEKNIAFICGVFVLVDIINNKMMPMSRAGFIGFCALTLVHFFRLERVFLFLLLVSIPQRHETPLYLVWNKKILESEPHTLGTGVGLLCHPEFISSLHPQIHAISTHQFTSSKGKMSSHVGTPEVKWSVRQQGPPKGWSDMTQVWSLVPRLVWNESQKRPTRPHQWSSTGPAIAAATR